MGPTASVSAAGHTIAHLTDLHLRPAADPLVGGVVDPVARLQRALDVLTSWDVRCDAWFFGGDLSDTGDDETYQRLAELVLPAAERAGAQVIWQNGNHDRTDAFARHLLGEGASAPLDREYRIGGLRLLAVDTKVEGAVHGHVGEASMEWLEDRLTDPAPAGTILALHHAPLPPVQAAARLWPLDNADALAGLLRGSDVRLILGGHFHQTGFGMLGGVPVAAATSLVYTQDLTAGYTLRGQDAHQGFNLVQVYEDTVVVSAVPLDPAAPVNATVTPAEVADLARRLL